MKTLVYIKKCYMVTLYKLLKDQIKLLKKQFVQHIAIEKHLYYTVKKLIIE
jgi:hypothetical protein